MRMKKRKCKRNVTNTCIVDKLFSKKKDSLLKTYKKEDSLLKKYTLNEEHI